MAECKKYVDSVEKSEVKYLKGICEFLNDNIEDYDSKINNIIAFVDDCVRLIKKTIPEILE